MRFKKSFIIITITILLISIVGFSVWIISKDFDVKPQPEIEKVITKYLNNSSGTYEGNVLLPSSEYIGAVDSNGRNTELVYYYKQNEEDNYIECVDSNKSIGPINVGEYFIKVIYTLSEGNINKQYEIEDIKFSILPKSIDTSNIIVDKCTYLGTAVTPNIKVSISLNNKTITLTKDIDYTVNYSNNENYGNGHIVINGIGNYVNTKEQDFLIRRAIYAINYEMDYDSSKRTWDVIKDQIKSNISFKDYIDDSNVDISGEIINVTSINDGTFEFNDTGNYSSDINNSTITGLESISNVVGSTYLINLDLSSEEFELMTPNNNPNNKNIKNPLFKYKTVEVNSNKYTIEDAILLGSGNIVLLGDSTTTTSFIYTAFCNLDSTTYPYNLSANDKYSYTITNRNLIIPYSTSTNIDKLDNPEKTDVAGNLPDIVYSSLYISKKNIIYFNNSTLLIDAKLGYKQPRTTVSIMRGIVKNEGKIFLENSSNIYAFGFLKGNGIIEALNGTTIQDAFATYDFPGGNTATSLQKSLPMNAWTVHNVSCKTKIYDGSFYKACFYAKPTAEAYTTVDIIGNSSNCLFKSQDNTGYIIKQSSNANSNSNANDLNIIIKSNQIAGQKDLIYLYGNYVDGTITISKGNFSIETGKNKACPISYLDLYVMKNSTLNLQNCSYLFLPGTTLTVDNGATLNVSTGVNLSFENYYHIKKIYDDKKASGDNAFYSYCKDTYDSSIIVNGSFISNGNIGGLVKSTQAGGVLDLNNSTLTSSFASMCNANGATAKSSKDCAYSINNFSAIGLINDINQYYTFNKETYTSILNEQIIVWSGSQGQGINNISDNGEQTTTDSVSCIVEGTLITLADGTKKKVENLTLNDQLLTFNHEMGLYDISNILFINNHNNIKQMHRILNLMFSDGTILRIVEDHGLFDMDLLKYIYISESNYKDYIGHKFYKGDYNGITYQSSYASLTTAYVTNEEVKIYAIITVGTMNCYTEGFLSMPTIPYNSNGLVNIFEYDNDLRYNQEKYNKDIEKYGLFTYDDFKNYMSYEAYLASPAKYLKVSMGKGYITYDDIALIIDYLLKNSLIE